MPPRRVSSKSTRISFFAFPSKPVNADLISKVAEAVLKMPECLDKPQNQELEVSDVDLFVLREVAISLVLEDRSLSLSLRRKIYELLTRPSIEDKAVQGGELRFVEDLLNRSDEDGDLNQLIEDL